MKKPLLILVLTIFFVQCQKEFSFENEETVKKNNEKVVEGKWKFVSFTDSARKTITNGNACWADNTLELRDNNTGLISQGACVENPYKNKDIEFTWRFINEDVVDMGGDTVKLTLFNDSVLQFNRINKSFLEYKWKR
jgi:hypothetical protein